MNRYQTIGPITTASIAAGASLQVDIDAALAGFAMPSSFNIVKVEIIPDASSIFDASVYKAASFVAGQLLVKWDDHTGNLYYPINRTGGGETEGLQGYPIPYDDNDGAGELHFKLTNGGAAAHTYTYTFEIEEVPAFTAAGNVAFRGSVTGLTGIFASVGPSAAQQHTLPVVTSDIIALLAATQTLTNKTISGSANTLSNIGNAALTNSSITVIAGTNMTGGGVVSLGGSVTLNSSGGGGGGVTSAIGTANQVIVSAATGDVTFSLPQSIGSTSSPAFAALTLTAPLTVPNGGTGVATLASNGVLYGNASGVVLVTSQGPANSVLTASVGAPAFSATPTLTSMTLTGTLAASGLATLSAGINLGTSQSINSTTSRLEKIGGTTVGQWNSIGMGIGTVAATNPLTIINAGALDELLWGNATQTLGVLGHSTTNGFIGLYAAGVQTMGMYGGSGVTFFNGSGNLVIGNNVSTSGKLQVTSAAPSTPFAIRQTGALGYGFDYKLESSGDLTLNRVVATVVTPMLAFEQASGYVGIGSNITPTSRLHLSGNMSSAAWTTSGKSFNSAAASYTNATSSGTVSDLVINSFGVPTLLATSVTTFTAAATVYIAGAPVASTNVTITNPCSLYVAAGNVRLAGMPTSSAGLPAGTLWNNAGVVSII